jgi:hypothetical protein
MFDSFGGLLKQVGVTIEGMPVMDGVFHLYATEGLPLELIFLQMQKRGWIPAWPTFYEDARANGWKHQTIVVKLREALADTWGPAFRNGVLERLEKIYGGVDTE